MDANGSGSCEISHEEVSKRDVIAAVRILLAFLSAVGSLSIIVSVVVRRQVSAPKMHPIFVLSVADCILSATWVIGGSFWFGRIHSRVWCFLPSLLSVVLECVTINLSLVYAGFAYSSIKSRNVTQDLARADHGGHGILCRPWITASVYCLAWLLPVVLILVPFGIIAALYHITEHANAHSCWCLPYFGNVLPMAFPEDEHIVAYVWDIRKLVATYGVVLGTNYLVVFILLLAIYYKILKYIKSLRRQHEQLRSFLPNYGAVDALIVKSESMARRRVIVFLTVFLISGCFNFILSYVFAVFEGIELHRGQYVQSPVHDHLPPTQFTLYLLESVTVPMQGFLNAIVYGWTREDFRAVVARSSAIQTRGRRRRRVKELEHSSSLQVSCGRSESTGLLAESNKLY